VPSPPAQRRFQRIRGAGGRGPRRVTQTGDNLLRALSAAAGLVAVLVLAGVVYQLIDNAQPSLSRFGLGFLGHTTWRPNFREFGAGALIFGTAVTSVIALVVATPLGIGIGLYLSMIAPRGVRRIVGPLVEMLAAIPSVILGFWGVIVLAPFVRTHLEPFLHDSLGFIPLFGQPQSTGLSLMTAGLILAVMVLPIIASISRDLFLTVPTDLTQGAEALGATRWEVMRGVVLPSTTSGVAAAVVLGLGRALGEAIAVAQVIGDGNGIRSSLFQPGATLTSRIALQFQETTPHTLYSAALFHLALILLVIGLATTLAARAIASRFDVERSYAQAVGV
jgi:phosphate transport system permease protein